MDTSTNLPTWADMCAQDHFVQFYEEDQTIIEAVAGYFAFGLRFKEGCLLIGTPDHNEAIISCIRDIGCDVDQAISDGKFMVLDAKDELSKFMVDGMPDRGLFEKEIGGGVAKVSTAAKPPRAFGEMVAVLAEQGNAAAALALEKLWNDLAKQTRFRLFCAYKHEMLSTPTTAPFSRDICSLHSHVIGLAPA